MEKMIETFSLEKRPKSTGAVKYKADTITDGVDYHTKEPRPWMVYFPQEIVRKDGDYALHIKVTMEEHLA